MSSDSPRPHDEPAPADDQYRPLFELSPQPAMIYDRESLRFLDVNQAALDRYGWSREAFLTLTLRDIRPPAQQQHLESALTSATADAILSTQAIHRTRSGEELRVELTSYPLRFAGCAARMALVNDVTERYSARSALVHSEEQYRSVIEQMQDVFYRTDDQGHFTFLNRAWELISGYTVQETLGSHYLTYVHPSDRTRLMDAVRLLTEGAQRSARIEMRYFQKGGGYRWMEASLRLSRAVGDLAAGSTGILRDITDRRAADEERARYERELIEARDAAEDASRAKSDFLARMSHELRTPLNSIIGFANVLLKNRHGSQGTEDLSYLSRVATNGRHLLGLINDILDLSKIEAGRMTLDLEPVRLDDLVRETLGELESQTRDHRVTLRAELPARVRPIESDRGRLKQVLINLAGNALKFTERGEVVVHLETDEHESPVTLSVRDTGIGIPGDRLAAIFNVFEQAEAMTARRYGGTGLGLAISRSLCELMGHSLTVSSAEGKGTTMTIAFDTTPRTAPIATTPASERVVPSAEQVARRDGGLVLVVDDDADACVLLKQVIEETGFEAIVATSGIEGLRMARDRVPALIFLDLQMPKISGVDVLRILLADELLSATPVVVVSVVASESRRSLPGAVAVLDKPFERDQVVQLIATYAGAPADRSRPTPPVSAG